MCYVYKPENPKESSTVKASKMTNKTRKYYHKNTYAFDSVKTRFFFSSLERTLPYMSTLLEYSCSW